MKKTFTIFIPICLLFAAIAQFSSCEKYILPAIQLEKDTVLFTPSAQQETLIVQSNVFWKMVVPSQDWMIISPEVSSGSESDTLHIAVTDNESGERRTAIVAVRSETLNKRLVIIQEGE